MADHWEKVMFEWPGVGLAEHLGTVSLEAASNRWKVPLLTVLAPLPTVLVHLLTVPVPLLTVLVVRRCTGLVVPLRTERLVPLRTGLLEGPRNRVVHLGSGLPGPQETVFPESLNIGLEERLETGLVWTLLDPLWLLSAE